MTQSTIYTLGTDAAFFSTFDVQFLAGSFYERIDRRHAHENLIINESAMRALCFPDPQAAVGEQIAYQGNTDGFRMTIRGVVAGDWGSVGGCGCAKCASGAGEPGGCFTGGVNFQCENKKKADHKTCRPQKTPKTLLTNL